MFKKLFSFKNPPKSLYFKKSLNFTEKKPNNTCSNKITSIFSCFFKPSVIFSTITLGFGLYEYSQGIAGLSKLSTEYQITKELYEQRLKSELDIKNCLEKIKNFKLSDDYLKRKSKPEHNPLNIDNLLIRLKERMAICLKGNYGSGTTEHALSIAEKWLEEGNHIIYYKPHSRLQVKSRIQELLKILNTNDEESFLKALKELRNEKKEILLIVDDLDLIDVNQRESIKFLNYLKNLQEENFLHTLYVFRTNLLERFITGLYNNDISLIFVGGNKFLDLQSQKEKDFVSKFCNVDEVLAQKFLFFFGMNYKNMKEYNDFVKYNQENNNDLKTVEDFIDAKIEKVVDSIELKGSTNDVLSLCRSIDSNGILNYDWKKSLASSQRSSLENNDILVISGTTTALTRAAIAKLCDKSWKNWDLSKWKGKWNIEYYL